MLKIGSLIFLLTLSLLAEDNRSIIDKFHQAIDVKVRNFGLKADETLVNTYDYFVDQNATNDQENNSSALDNSETIDTFFKTQKELEDSDETFLRIGAEHRFNSLDEAQTRAIVRARLGLGRTKERLRLFIEDLTEDSIKNVGEKDENNAPSIGLEFFAKERYGIKPRYSAGIRGLDPFVRVRFTYKGSAGIWKIQPVQTFRYALNDGFSEKSELYFDTPTSCNTLFRFLIDRGTNQDERGMDYNGYVQWFYTLSKHEGISITLGLNGNTRYEREGLYIPLGTHLEDKIFNYFFSFRYRRNIFKPWIFYEITPGVNYHEEFQYRPNYSIAFRIDLFFGHI